WPAERSPASSSTTNPAPRRTSRPRTTANLPHDVSDRRKYILLVAAIAVALAGVAYIALPGSPGHKKPTLGLDLQGGLEVVLKAQPPPGRPLTAADLDLSVQIMRNRIDKLGVSEPEIRKQGKDQIVIQLAGVQDPRTAFEIIGKTASL